MRTSPTSGACGGATVTGPPSLRIGESRQSGSGTGTWQTAPLRAYHAGNIQDPDLPLPLHAHGVIPCDPMNSRCLTLFTRSEFTDVYPGLAYSFHGSPLSQIESMTATATCGRTKSVAFLLPILANRDSARARVLSPVPISPARHLMCSTVSTQASTATPHARRSGMSTIRTFRAITAPQAGSAPNLRIRAPSPWRAGAPRGPGVARGPRRSTPKHCPASSDRRGPAPLRPASPGGPARWRAPRHSRGWRSRGYRPCRSAAPCGQGTSGRPASAGPARQGTL